MRICSLLTAFSGRPLATSTKSHKIHLLRELVLCYMKLVLPGMRLPCRHS